MAKIIFNCSHGQEDPERAILPFVAANVAATAGQDAIVLLTIEGAWLCTKGYSDPIKKDGFPDLRPLMTEFVENGGQIWGCGACTTPRGITEDDLVKGATIVGAAKIVEEIVQGATPIAFA
ncbi:MAG: DsrE family protein [Actinomycetota bacterium]|nr:DsrE family protein [Actinomycetota bacterium]